uniref:Uncharacterized protein n=1 Tax=Musa balbisiana TaxID=52838 RepID=B5RHV4_MUSBA|nr:uncharacterized protein [Musa balbisiana]
MPPQDGAHDKDTNLVSMKRMIAAAIVVAAAATTMATVAIATTVAATTTTAMATAMAAVAIATTEAIAEEIGGSYSEEERWGSAGEHSNRDAAVEGNRRWRRVTVEKIVVVRRGGKICHTDNLTTKLLPPEAKKQR